MEAKVLFLAEAAKVLGATETVLIFFGRKPTRRDDLDFAPFADALLTLCQDHRRDSAGISDIRELIAVFDAVRMLRAVTAEELRSGIESSRRYFRWLRETFPNARRGNSGN